MLEANLLEHRKKFPALANKHYLNFGAQGTMANSALNAIRSSYDFVQEKGPLSAGMFAWIQKEVSSTKELLAEEFGGQALSYALTQNATEGCNIVLWGQEWQEGETLLTTDSEHNGVMKAAIQLCKRRKLSLEICKLAELNDHEIIAALEKSLEATKPRLFMLSHVLWNTGRVLPLKKILELCRAHSVRVLVDGAQSAGVLPLDLKEIGADYYAFTGHKWIGGPEGVGALYIEPSALESIEPTYCGWRGAQFDSKGNAIDWLPDASRFEVATAPFPLLAGLCEAIKVHRQAGSTTERFNLILENTKRLKEELASIKGLRLLDEHGGSSLVSFVIEGASHIDLVKQLEANKFILRTIPNPLCIRASVHYFSAEDLISFVETVKNLL